MDTPRRRDGSGQDAAPADVQRTAGLVDGLRSELSTLEFSRTAPDEPKRIQQLCALISSAEELKNALAGLQATATNTLLELREAQAEQDSRPGAGLDLTLSDVQQSRHVPPSRARTLIEIAHALHEHLPSTRNALCRGHATEAQAGLVTSKTSVLSDQNRTTVDAKIGPALRDLSRRATAAELERLSAELDPEAAKSREKTERANRHVALISGEDGMAKLFAKLPAAHAQAAYRSLSAAADTATAAGDARSRGQLMADALVARIMGTYSAPVPPEGADPLVAAPGTAGPLPEVPVEIQVVMTDLALLGLSDTPARLTGVGPIPAPVARMLAAGQGGEDVKDVPDEKTPAASDEVAVFIRRLYAEPGTGRLVNMESSRRAFPTAMKRFVVARDAVCRTVGCEADIRHIDHVVPHRAGGATSLSNAQGLCASCNQRKEKAGWKAEAHPDGKVTTRTPDGRSWTSWPAPLPMESRFGSAHAA